MSYKLKLYYLCFLTNMNSLNINENVKKSLLCFGVPIGGFLAIYLITKTNETKSEPKDKIDEIYENNINIKGTLSSRDKDTIINQIINNENSDLIKKKLIQLKKTEKIGLDKIELEKKIELKNIKTSNRSLYINIVEIICNYPEFAEDTTIKDKFNILGKKVEESENNNELNIDNILKKLQSDLEEFTIELEKKIELK